MTLSNRRSFKRFLNTVEVHLAEETLLVHKTAAGQVGAWTLRRPATDHDRRPQLLTTLDRIVLKDAAPWIDHGAKERGDKVVAYIKGERVKDVVEGVGRDVGYFKDEESPFRYVDDRSEYTGSTYAVFDGRSFKAFA